MNSRKQFKFFVAAGDDSVVATICNILANNETEYEVRNGVYFIRILADISDEEYLMIALSVDIDVYRDENRVIIL